MWSVGSLISKLGGHDGLALGINRSLGVVGLNESLVGAEHHP